MRALGTLALTLIAILLSTVYGSEAVRVTDNAKVPSSAQSSISAPASGEWYKVVKVIDGDTIVISMDGKNETIRMIGVDTPETVDPRTTVQCFGTEASDEVKKILGSQYARIEMDASQGERDKYGRLLAYVYAPLSRDREGLLLNEYLIAEGYGYEYTYNLPYTYQSEFKTAELRARAEKKGLWAEGACTQKPIVPLTDTAWTLPLPFSNDTYECSRNTYNCSDFSKQTEAQHVFETCGGSTNDIHLLDRDRDGRVCESLP